jgi:hypothetical protein
MLYHFEGPFKGQTVNNASYAAGRAQIVDNVQGMW